MGVTVSVGRELSTLVVSELVVGVVVGSDALDLPPTLDHIPGRAPRQFTLPVATR